MSRVVVVPADSPLINSAATVKLHSYPNGQVLIRTDAAADENGEAEQPVEQGLQVPNTSVQSDAAAAPEELPTGEFLGYVEFAGPIDGEWLNQLRSVGVEPLRYHPYNAYLCRARDAEAFKAAAALPVVLSVRPLTGGMKPKAETLSEAGADVLVVVQATPEETESVLASLRATPGVEIDDEREPERVDFTVRFRARVSAEGQDALLHHPKVLAVEPFEHPHPEDEVAGLIVAGQYDLKGKPNGSYLRWLEDHGLNGEGVTIGIVDSGVNVAHPAFAGRIKDLNQGRQSWHGTFVAGHAAGCYLDEKDPNNYIYGIGIAPAAHLLIQDNGAPATSLCLQSVTEKAPSGIAATIQNNSWGKGLLNPMNYGSDEAIYDKMARNADPGGSVARPLTICFSSGNSGQQGLTRPKSAKNIIVTGNSENYRPEAGRDESDNIEELFSGAHPSSWGNLGDGRIRPHVVAPGEWTASAGFDTRKGDPEYISPNLTWGGGSSGASPKTAAVCALVTQWWRKRNAGKDPSPAMLRALVVNGAVPLAAAGPIPNNRQGWGRLNIGNIVSEQVPHTYCDQTVLLKQFGDKQEWNLTVGDPLQPVKITLAWTDPPGPIGSGGTPAASPIVNRLGLRAEVNGQVYRANEFQQGWSVAASGASSTTEGSDNLQNIFLPAGTAKTTLRINVNALNLTTNCVTGAANAPQQDFALVVTNARTDSAAAPAPVTVVIDTKAKSAPPPPQPSGYWKVGSANTDEQELNAAWWSKTEPPPAPAKKAVTAPVKLPQPGKPDRKQREESWWTAADLIFSTSKKDAAPAEEAERDSTSLARTLEASADSKAAVVVVSGGTRVSAEDVERLRRIAFNGNLYLVSDDAALLEFLVQRIHLRHGVQVRVANSKDELDALLSDTLSEASGMQRLGVTSTAGTHSLDVAAADRRLILHLRYPEEALLGTVRLYTPDGSSIEILPTTAASVEAVQKTGELQITVDAAPGRWELHHAAASATLDAWAETSLGITIRQQADSDEAVLLTVAGGTGVMLSRAVVNGDVLAAQTSRLAADTTDPAAPTLSTWLTTQRSRHGARILDIPVEVEGADESGYRFERQLRTSVIRLEARGNWRKRVTAKPEPLLIAAVIVNIQYEGGEVTAMRLRKGHRARNVAVRNPALRSQLACLNLADAADETLLFGVSGDEVTGMFRVFDPTLVEQPEPVALEGDRGIDQAVPALQPPPGAEAQRTDYPQASRFVAARAFRNGSASRRIDRIVIHITDGGSRIDGTISWFQNPASGVSAHYIVGQDGEVVQMVRDRDIAFHANGANAASIGIEHCARSATALRGQPALYPSTDQYAASAALVRWLCAQHGVPMDRDHIQGHSEADTRTTHRDCPNAVWDWDYYMDLLRSTHVNRNE